MDYKRELFEVEVTDECIEEMMEIYEYISKVLKEDNVAKKLITEVNNRILDLDKLPDLYMRIGKVDRLRREYHRMVVKNYAVLYTIVYEKRKIYVSSITYGKRNYLNLY